MVHLDGVSVKQRVWKKETNAREEVTALPGTCLHGRGECERWLVVPCGVV